MIVRQSGIAHALCDAEPAEDLHGARGNVVALHARQFVATALLGHDDIDAAPGKIHRQRGADRPAADHQHARGDAPHQGGQITFTSACCPPRTAAAARRNAAGRSAGRSTRSP